MAHDEKNKFDNKDSLEIGNKAENIFVEIAKKKGYSIEFANVDEDMNEHWDYRISKDDAVFQIDVKASKRISRSDSSVQDEWIWIELHGVRKKDRGWLFGGKSDLIAFERANDFIIVKTEDLKALIPEKLEKNPNSTKKEDRFFWVEKSAEAQYKLYQRKGRSDIITLIHFTDLDEIIWETWKK